MAQHVLIVGAGVLGKALAQLMPRERVQVSLWDTDASKCGPERIPLETSVPAADFIFMCVPSWAMRQATAQLSSLLRSQTVVLSLAKGLEASTGKPMSDVLAETLPPNQPHGVLGGALLAHEIGTGLPGMAVIACRDDAVAANLLTMLSGTALQLSWSSDARSVAVAGVLKNVYALLLGIADGLGLGSNTRGWLFAQAVREMMDIGKMLKVDQQVLLSVAGIGDLVATGLSAQSKNHAAGVELAQTGRTAVVCEGVTSVPALMHLVGARPSLRLLNALDAILARGQNVRLVVQDLIYKRQ